MKIISYAKINIGLRVVGKREDGYHDLETLFQQISLCDELTCERTDDGLVLLQSSDPACPSDATNLIVRAAALLKPIAKDDSAGCFIRLHKIIPMGAGLGGGSSNAAATLKALNRLWECGLMTGELLQLAASLGSDVPFFINGGLALGQGRGEVLTPLPHKPPYHGLLIAPEFHISTKSVYEKLNSALTITVKMRKFGAFRRALPPFDQWPTLFHNDLELVVFKEYPTLKEIVRRLYAIGAFHAAMSGSGSSVFGLFETEEAAAHAAHDMQDFQTFLFKPIYG